MPDFQHLMLFIAAGWIFSWLDRVAGAMFIGFGVKLALSDNPSK